LNIKLSKLSVLFGFLVACHTGGAMAQSATEQKVKAEMQKQIGERAKVESVRPAPVAGLYEVAIGKDVIYTDATARYLIQGEIVDLKSGTNLTEQRINELNLIKWSDLPLADAIKTVRGDGSRQLAVFADPHCGYCKRLEKTLADLNNVTVYTFLIPMLSADSHTSSKKIWCSADKSKAWSDWMNNAIAPTGKTDCTNPLERNIALGKKIGVTGTPAIFFKDGSRITGSVPLAQIEKKLK
jgi:thiol:disulfide interchange protein DsbC